MKRWKKILVSFLTVCMLLSLSAANVMAEEYPYKVTLYAGNKGTIGGAPSVTKEYGQGETVDYRGMDIKATDDKYYVKGIRISGRDNQELFPLNTASFTVDSDMDYVVAYGISANRTAYTVTYKDESGRELAPSQTLYGDVGDKPVIAYQYIENYVPTTQAFTLTLSANAADNIVPFVYRPGVAETIIPGQTIVVTETETTTTTVGGAAAGTTGGTGAAPAAEGGTAGNEAAAAAAANETAEAAGGGETVENPDEEVPQGLVDLDDEETPKGNIKETKESSGSPVPIIAGIAIGALAVLSLITFVVMSRRRKK